MEPASSSQEPKASTRKPSYRIPHGFDKLLHLEPELSLPPPSPRRTSKKSRYHLHIRQQPIAARACSAGDRNRRPIDPPRIVQILLTNFDSESRDDRAMLKGPRFTVGCLLFPASECSHYLPNTEKDQLAEVGDGNGVTRAGDTFSTPLISGKTFVSPFFADVDPDPKSTPTHPPLITHTMPFLLAFHSLKIETMPLNCTSRRHSLIAPIFQFLPPGSIVCSFG